MSRITVSGTNRMSRGEAMALLAGARGGNLNTRAAFLEVLNDALGSVAVLVVSVFIVHGLQDDNVKTNHFAELWYALQELDKPRKLWLTRAGHEEGFDFRRAEWVDTIHRWFDRWLFDIDNGIEQEPKRDIETDRAARNAMISESNEDEER